MKDAILAVPSTKKGRGGGHLIRSAALVRELRGLGRRAFLHVPAAAGSSLEGLLNLAGPWETSWTVDALHGGGTWALILLDNFRTSPEEYRTWSALGPLAGIDEGGAWRDRFDFLIDLLPRLPGGSPPNISALGTLPRPQSRRASFFEPPRGPLRILVSFGAEDPRGLSIPAALALANPPRAEITLVRGGMGKPPPVPAEALEFRGIRVLEGIPGLREKLAEYDLLVTHFGLTAIEALHARLPVVLVSPGACHERLGRFLGFASCGRGRRGAARLGRCLYGQDRSKPRGLPRIAAASEDAARRLGADRESAGTFASLLEEFSPVLPRRCPVCGAGPEGPVLARFPRRTYRRCPACGMVYMLRLTKAPVEYAEDYFFGSYKKQYGKTYLEDFPHLVQMGKARLGRILQIRRRMRMKSRLVGEGGTLLDIGCAYGPFLAAAREEGFSPAGLDPAEGAVRYVREELGLPAYQGFFPDIPGEIREGRFDVISLWYVIEHFEEPRRALAEIHRLLKPGGVLAFSTPSFSGISRRKSLRTFLEQSPPDHWTLWTPGDCKKLLGAFGFTLKKIVYTGHHPERFPLLGSRVEKNSGPAYRFLSGISRAFGLGDTFEVYGVKKIEGENHAQA
jgi:2-polyprenyl-3-methyl-5-hydroxy-6-metoxy-1,4-benzoquinol methylase